MQQVQLPGTWRCDLPGDSGCRGQARALAV